MSEFTRRCKQGILSVTELQKLNWNIRSTWIMIVGILCGIGVSIYYAKTTWWLIIILTAAFFNTVVALIGLYQKKVWITKLEEGQNE